MKACPRRRQSNYGEGHRERWTVRAGLLILFLFATDDVALLFDALKKRISFMRLMASENGTTVCSAEI